MSKASDAGKSFLDGVLAKVPEAKRAAVKEVLLAEDSVAALEVLGTGALGQSEINRRFDDLTKQEGDLKARTDTLATWFSQNEAALKEYPTLKAEVDKLKKGGGPPVGEEEPPDPRDIALQVVNEAGRDYINVGAWLAAKAVSHSRLFGEELNLMEIVNNPKLGKPITGQPGRVYSLDDAYAEKHGERVQAKAKEAEDKRINDEVDKRLGEKLKTLPQNQPFPLRGGAEPSVLDTLTQKDGAAAHTLDSAVTEYERLQQARSGTA